VQCEELPIYGCRFSEQDTLKLLRQYLIKIDISQARSVQLIADGPPWIWNRVPDLLVELGVKKEQLTQTLDYYHASQYVHNLVDAMPKRVSKTERKRLLSTFLDCLNTNKVAEIVRSA